MCIFALKTHLLVTMLTFLDGTTVFHVPLAIKTINSVWIVSLQSVLHVGFLIASSYDSETGMISLFTNLSLTVSFVVNAQTFASSLPFSVSSVNSVIMIFKIFCRCFVTSLSRSWRFRLKMATCRNCWSAFIQFEKTELDFSDLDFEVNFFKGRILLLVKKY